ncbi:MAG: hypothetical protein WKF96_23035 [Solirubrobacteraceae bacterium]
MRPVGERRARTFAGQDAAAATRTAGREFPDFVQEKAWTDLRERPGVEVERYLEPTTAIVEADGKSAVVQSQLPLSVKTPDGLKAVDADLVRVGARMKPRRPLTAYTLEQRASVGLLAFEASGLAVGPGAASSDRGSCLTEAIFSRTLGRPEPQGHLHQRQRWPGVRAVDLRHPPRVKVKSSVGETRCSKRAR